MTIPEGMKFYSPEADVTAGRNRLPHWDQQGRTYALTFRLADSVPAHLLRDLRLQEEDWRRAHPEPWSNEEEKEFARKFTGVVERWMDAGAGSCLLRDAGCAQIVAKALHFFEGVRTRLHAWVVMPNHVHVLAEILEGHTLPEVMESWKGFTARRINERLGRIGTLWQKGYHDRLVRDWTHFGNVVRNVRRNPEKARVPPGQFLRGESSLAMLF
jgi:REP element-mobilizing transposase RayT